MEQLICLMFLQFFVNRRAYKLPDRPILMPPVYGNLLDPNKQEHNERNLVCKCCIVM